MTPSVPGRVLPGFWRAAPGAGPALCPCLALSPARLPWSQEGRQASLAADFSVSQFKHIGRLLVVHGRSSYKRSAALSQFVMHRGLIISTMQVRRPERPCGGAWCLAACAHIGRP